MPVVVAIGETTTLPRLELARKPFWAAYSASSVCEPAFRPDSVKLADPLARVFETGVPLSTLSVTLPEGVPEGEVIVTETVPLAPKASWAGALSWRLVSPGTKGTT